MNLLSNKNVSKEFRKALNKVTLWRSGKNPKVTLESSVDPTKDHIRVNSNDVWGKPKSYMMKRETENDS